MSITDIGTAPTRTAPTRTAEDGPAGTGAEPGPAPAPASAGSVGPIFSVGGAVERAAGDLAEDFHEASKITRITHPGWTDVRYAQQLAQEAQGVADAGPGGATSAPRLLPALALPPALPLPHGLGATMAARRSADPDELAAPLALAELATVLRFAYGQRGGGTGRFVPSAGGLYPLDLHVVVRAAEGVAAGIHQLDPLEEALVDVSGLDRAGRLARFRRAAPRAMAPLAEQAAVTIVITGSFERSRTKYGLRGYRLTLLEAGHVAQNALLVATALGLPSIGWVGFVDHELDAVLGLDGVTQSSLYAVSLGGRPDPGGTAPPGGLAPAAAHPDHPHAAAAGARHFAAEEASHD
ncbi:SagB/ThcOx family dehydrogenase [Clavibacter sp. VKM Ac-2872]|uniref:SagB/ThcOx family dehydrogenase n=1 Tax=Clavibacter sp. VKM Ac-2872 TaxID=2783812 RepID=UPI00188B3D96|nr:SagB/ThcOx family dehydrogenase [Clavibacter sp. VKM Ac-2872]MBF4624858.1 SagB/ThcOx family dehydrogenase [Clavibacter sp. VKM Ac-2872]